MKDSPLILITNDDGVHAEGIRALKNALSSLAHAVIVAPAEERSACGHAITLRKPLGHAQHDKDVFSVDGTPADCVALAIFGEHFLPRRPDLVLSGINHGVNLGTDIFYSGTVAGAREATMRGITGMALSCQIGGDFQIVAEIASQMALALIRAPKTAGAPVLLNVNFPKTELNGVVISRLSTRTYESFVKTKRDASGGVYHWIGGAASEAGAFEGSDTDAIKRGYISVTPLAMDAINVDHVGVAAAVIDECQAQWRENLRIRQKN